MRIHESHNWEVQGVKLSSSPAVFREKKHANNCVIRPLSLRLVCADNFLGKTFPMSWKICPLVDLGLHILSASDSKVKSVTSLPISSNFPRQSSNFSSLGHVPLFEKKLLSKDRNLIANTKSQAYACGWWGGIIIMTTPSDLSHLLPVKSTYFPVILYS